MWRATGLWAKKNRVEDNNIKERQANLQNSRSLWFLKIAQISIKILLCFNFRFDCKSAGLRSATWHKFIHITDSLFGAFQNFRSCYCPGNLWSSAAIVVEPDSSSGLRHCVINGYSMNWAVTWEAWSLYLDMKRHRYYGVNHTCKNPSCMFCYISFMKWFPYFWHASLQL